MESLFGLSEQSLLMVPAFLFVLTVVVFFHELGHFLVARWCGVGVKAFSIGFGREIFGWTDSHGTRWKIAWIPLGGYVKFMDDENAASVPDREALERMTPEQRATSFHGKPLWQRAAVVAAGPIANFILAIVIFALLFTFIGQRNTPAIVDEVSPGSVAARAGFQAGDLIVAIDGREVRSFSAVQRTVFTSGGSPLRFTVRRAGRELNIDATPEYQETTDKLGNKTRHLALGIKRTASADQWVLERHDPVTALGMAVRETYSQIELTLKFIARLVVGKESSEQLAGPIGIAVFAGQAASLGFISLITLTAALSIGIGLINLFPIPMLDGGHLLFYAIEAIRGRALSERTQEIGFRIGLTLVLMLMIFSVWNDVNHRL